MQWHQLDHMQTHNHNKTSSLIFTGRMLFLSFQHWRHKNTWNSQRSCFYRTCFRFLSVVVRRMWNVRTTASSRGVRWSTAPPAATTRRRNFRRARPVIRRRSRRRRWWRRLAGSRCRAACVDGGSDVGGARRARGPSVVSARSARTWRSSADSAAWSRRVSHDSASRSVLRYFSECFWALVCLHCSDAVGCEAQEEHPACEKLSGGMLAWW